MTKSLDMKIKSPFLNLLLCRVAVVALKLTYKCTRIDIRLGDPVHDPYNSKRDQECVYSVWHDQILYPLFMQTPQHIVAVVGRHRDGDYVSNILKALKLKAIRGSSSRGGTEAVLQALDLVQDHSLVITPDGPRGPRWKMKAGCAFVASQTGIPVVATAFSCSNAWHVQGSWTDLVIPKPFSKVYALTSEPIHIPPKATREELEGYTEQIQAEMDRLAEIAIALAEGREIEDQSQPALKEGKLAA
ncbi:lysophospholipid acyltransferase family protein [Planctomicrobium sp.]|jgi:lysophospholipid acyltransferase (LPLAT)-like uncharacterized protein|nr:lysophospholipid acyltransferase family protein [Planctomicrobium sp.]MDB4439732.1 lysophospholipid acyltransferase family protein [Planctomicrobium sp.]